MKLNTIALLLIAFLFLFGSCAKKAGEVKLTLETDSVDEISMKNRSLLAAKRLSLFLDCDVEKIKTETQDNRINISFDFFEGDSVSPGKVVSLLSSNKEDGLEIWEVYDNLEIDKCWKGACEKLVSFYGDSVLREMTKSAYERNGRPSRKPEYEINDRAEPLQNLSFPFSAYLIPLADSKGRALPGTCAGYCKTRDTAALMNFLRLPEVLSQFPPDVVFCFGSHTVENVTAVVGFFCLKKTKDGPAMSGEILESAETARTDYGYSARLSFNEKGAGEFSAVTERVVSESATLAAQYGRALPYSQGYEIKKGLAIVLEKKVTCAPIVAEKIANGRAEIAGNFSEEECNIMVAKLLSPLNFFSRVVAYDTSRVSM